MPKRDTEQRPSEAKPDRPRGDAALAPAALLTTAEEQAAVLDLVRQGKNFREIAADLQCSLSTVSKRYTDGRNAIPAEMAAHIAAEVVERERAIIDSHWAKRGDPESAKIIQASDKLILATLPTKTEVSGSLGVTAAVTPAEARKVMSELFPGSVGPLVSEADSSAPDDVGAPKGASSE